MEQSSIEQSLHAEVFPSAISTWDSLSKVVAAAPTLDTIECHTFRLINVFLSPKLSILAVSPLHGSKQFSSRDSPNSEFRFA